MRGLELIIKAHHDTVFRMCRLKFNFRNLPFSKSFGKNCVVFVCRGGISVAFSPFQIVPVSCGHTIELFTAENIV